MAAEHDLAAVLHRARDGAGRQRFREHFGGDAGGIEDLAAPGEGGYVEGHRARGERIVDDAPSGEEEDDVVLDEQDVLRLREDLRLVGLDPHQLRQRIGLTRLHARDGSRAAFAKGLREGPALFGAPAVGAEEDRAQGAAGRIREDEGLAEAADADRVEPAEAVAGGAHGVEDGGAERDGVDFLRVVGAPDGIVAVFAAEAFAIGREDRDLAPRGADVETCDELHASISVQS